MAELFAVIKGKRKSDALKRFHFGEVMYEIDKALWMKESSHCTICQTEWGKLQWRYNCRSCGILVCNNCSSNRFAHKRMCQDCISKVEIFAEKRKLLQIACLESFDIDNPKTLEQFGLNMELLDRLAECLKSLPEIENTDSKELPRTTSIKALLSPVTSNELPDKGNKSPGPSEAKFVTSPVYKYHKYKHALQAVEKQAEERKGSRDEPPDNLSLHHPKDSMQLIGLENFKRNSIAKREARDRSFVPQQFVSFLPLMASSSGFHSDPDPAWMVREVKISFERLEKLFECVDLNLDGYLTVVKRFEDPSLEEHILPGEQIVKIASVSCTLHAALNEIIEDFLSAGVKEIEFKVRTSADDIAWRKCGQSDLRNFATNVDDLVQLEQGHILLLKSFAKFHSGDLILAFKTYTKEHPVNFHKAMFYDKLISAESESVNIHIRRKTRVDDLPDIPLAPLLKAVSSRLSTRSSKRKRDVSNISTHSDFHPSSPEHYDSPSSNEHEFGRHLTTSPPVGSKPGHVSNTSILVAHARAQTLLTLTPNHKADESTQGFSDLIAALAEEEILSDEDETGLETIQEDGEGIYLLFKKEASTNENKDLMTGHLFTDAMEDHKKEFQNEARLTSGGAELPSHSAEREPEDATKSHGGDHDLGGAVLDDDSAHIAISKISARGVARIFAILEEELAENPVNHSANVTSMFFEDASDDDGDDSSKEGNDEIGTHKLKKLKHRSQRSREEVQLFIDTLQVKRDESNRRVREMFGDKKRDSENIGNLKSAEMQEEILDWAQKLPDFPPAEKQRERSVMSDAESERSERSVRSILKKPGTANRVDRASRSMNRSVSFSREVDRHDRRRKRRERKRRKMLEQQAARYAAGHNMYRYPAPPPYARPPPGAYGPPGYIPPPGVYPYAPPPGYPPQQPYPYRAFHNQTGYPPGYPPGPGPGPAPYTQYPHEPPANAYPPPVYSSRSAKRDAPPLPRQNKRNSPDSRGRHSRRSSPVDSTRHDRSRSRSERPLEQKAPSYSRGKRTPDVSRSPVRHTNSRHEPRPKSQKRNHSRQRRDPHINDSRRSESRRRKANSRRTRDPSYSKSRDLQKKPLHSGTRPSRSRHSGEQPRRPKSSNRSHHEKPTKKKKKGKSTSYRRRTQSLSPLPSQERKFEDEFLDHRHESGPREIRKQSDLTGYRSRKYMSAVE